MKVLHIDCSVRNEISISKHLSKLFMTRLIERFGNVEVDYLDLAKDIPSHPTPLLIQGNYSLPENRTPEMLEALKESEALVDRMINADTYVIGMPMYNFSVPSIFKAFIDNIVRIGRTFKMIDGNIDGLLVNKKAFVINTRGVDFHPDYMAPMDQLVPYMKVVFGFMGITDITFINVSPVQFAETEARENSLKQAQADIDLAITSL